VLKVPMMVLVFAAFITSITKQWIRG